MSDLIHIPAGLEMEVVSEREVAPLTKLEIPFCRNCRHFQKSRLSRNEEDAIEMGQCSHDSGFTLSPVSGRKLPIDAHTNRAMITADKCGPSGKFFKPI